jgi:hypothetical protein
LTSCVNEFIDEVEYYASGYRDAICADAYVDYNACVVRAINGCGYYDDVFYYDEAAVERCYDRFYSACYY